MIEILASEGKEFDARGWHLWNIRELTKKTGKAQTATERKGLKKGCTQKKKRGHLLVKGLCRVANSCKLVHGCQAPHCLRKSCMRLGMP